MPWQAKESAHFNTPACNRHTPIVECILQLRKTADVPYTGGKYDTAPAN
jgi:hypothetical protein